jgi:Mg2+ and Co2+ transporter CorA
VQIEEELANMNAALSEYNQQRSTEAVNRLAMLSMIFGAGAVLTGFFGMNFGHMFERYLFKPEADTIGVHIGAVAVVTLITMSIILLGIYLVAVNWRDYRFILRDRNAPTKRHRWFSLRTGG